MKFYADRQGVIILGPRGWGVTLTYRMHLVVGFEVRRNIKSKPYLVIHLPFLEVVL